MNRLQDSARFAALFALLTSFSCATSVPAAESPEVQRATAPALEPFVIEYYYKAKWGFAAEFIELFKRNYLPQLEEMRRQGRILQFVAHTPRHHSSEEARWDFRLQVTWRDVVTAHDDHHPEELIRQLFPDRERHRAEERHRFEILIAHWDVLVEEEDLAGPVKASDEAEERR